MVGKKDVWEQGMQEQVGCAVAMKRSHFESHHRVKGTRKLNMLAPAVVAVHVSASSGVAPSYRVKQVLSTQVKIRERGPEDSATPYEENSRNKLIILLFATLFGLL